MRGMRRGVPREACPISWDHGEVLEVFLEGEVGVLEGRAGSNKLCRRLYNGKICAVVGALLGDIGVVAPGHKRYGVGVLLLYRYLMYHCLNGGTLILTAEGHKDGSRTDGGVESLGETALRAGVEVGSNRLHTGGKALGNLFIVVFNLRCFDVDVLLCAIGVEEVAADVNDSLAVPGHSESALCLDGSDYGCLKVLGCGKSEESILILGLDNDSHSLLRLGDRKLGAVETVILLGYCVEVDVKTVCKLADSNRNTACAEVITALDHSGNLAVSEETLKLSLLGGVTLLHLCAAILQRLEVMGFR